MLTALVTPQGEVTIPEPVRKCLGLEHGGEIKFVEYESGWYTLIALKDSISDLPGLLTKPDVHFSIEEMNEIVARSVAAAAAAK
jgi:antitoxin PrlF